MATPIRMAPVLYGKDAEYFYETAHKMQLIPDSTAPTKEYMERYRNFMAKY